MKRVLVVDDDPDILELMEELLRDQYEVILAPDGRAALEAVARSRVDAIVLDLMMPLMSGQEVMRELHKLPTAPPVILLSAARDLAGQAKALGAVGHCSKPCSPEKLTAAIERALAAGSEPPRPTASAPPPRGSA